MPGSIISSLDVAIEVEPGKSNWRAADTCAYFMAPADPQYRKELAVAVLVDEITGQVYEATASHMSKRSPLRFKPRTRRSSKKNAPTLNSPPWAR
jgi:hypothetical protein